MIEIPTKNTGDSLTAVEFNQLPDEIENIISSSGQTPSNSILDQLAKATVNVSSNCDFYTDSGSANSYVLSAISPNKSPTLYRNGMLIRFRASNNNTGASTVNVAGLGVVSIKQRDGSGDLISDQINTIEDTELRYNGTYFILNKLDTFDINFGYGFVPKSNATTPDTNVDITSGKIVAKDVKTILSLDSDVTGLNLETLLGGALAVDTTYHLMRYLKNNDTFQWYISTNISPTIGDIKSTDAYRRILSIKTDSSGDIIHFIGYSFGDISIYIRYEQGITEYLGAGSATKTLLTLSLIPINIRVWADITLGRGDSTSNNQNYSVFNPDFDPIIGQTNYFGESDLYSGVGSLPYDIGGRIGLKLTNTSAQVAHKGNVSGTIHIGCNGYLDNRLI